VAIVTNTGVVTPVSAGTTNITYTVTDGSSTQCQATSAPFTVTVNSIPDAPGITVLINCDGTATLTATGVTGSLLWSTTQTINPIIVSANGTYTVTQTSLGCTSLPGSATVTLLVHNGTDWYVSTSGNDANIGTSACPFATIQHGVTAASSGNIVHVAAGTYDEHVIINTPLTLTGADKATTFIDGTGTGNVVTITANNVIMTGFTVQNSDYTGPGTVYSAILLDGVSGCNINGNNLTHNANGIMVQNSPGTTRNIFNNNVITNNSWNGIYVLASNNVTITNTTITTMGYSGILLESNVQGCIVGSAGNGNTISIMPAYGIGLFGSTTLNTLSYNNIQNCGSDPNHSWAIYATSSISNTFDHNTISNCPGVGITLVRQDASYTASNSNTISNNTISHTGNNAINVDFGSYGNNITGNIITYCNYPSFLHTDADVDAGDAAWGIAFLDGAYNNTVTGNDISLSDVGIENWSNAGTGNVATGNKIYSNFCGLHNVSGTLMNASSNWWGAASGPYRASDNTCGTGNYVTDNVTICQWYTNILMTPAYLNGCVIALFNVTGGGSYCAGGAGIAITLSGSETGVNYELWINGSATGTIMPGTGSALTFTGVTASGTYTIKATNTITGCANVLMNNSVVVTINALPIAGAITGNDAVCMGSTLTLTSNATGTPIFTYTWASPNQGVAIVDNSGVVTPLAPGMTNITYTVTDGSSTHCQATSAPFTVTVNVLPTITITGLATVCLNSTNAYITESGMTGYSWMVSAGGSINGSATNNTVSVTWNTAGAQSVSVNYTNINGCTGASPTIYPVTVNPAPSPTVNGINGLVCNGSTGNIYYTEAGMTGYTWTVPGGIITSGIGTSSITVTWTTSGIQTVNVNYENTYGCYSATPGSKTVIVIPLPTPTILGPSDVCQGSTVNYTTESGMSNYTWSISAGGSITSGAGTNSIIVTWNTTGAQTVSVTYNNTFGCSAAAPTVYPVMVNPLPSPTILGPTSACANSAGTLYVTQGGMTSYLWTVSAGGNITSGAGTDSITVSWNTAGAQTVSVRYTNAFGCTIATPTVRNVTVNALPTPTITGQNLPNIGTAYVYTTQSGMTNYLWTVSSGGSITAGGGTGNNTITILWNVAGSQSVSVNYTNSNGCSAASPTVYPVTVSQSLSTISGFITYYNSVNTVMNNVTVTLQGTSYSAVTNSLGYYQIQNVPAGTYTMVCTTVKPTTGAINSADAALTNQWSNSQNNGSWPAIQLVKFFSGDVSGNNTIQPNDPSLMLAYFVNSWNTWVGHSPNPRPDWTFWFPGTTTLNSSSAGFYPQITVPANTIVTQNLYGLVTGDFNQSLVPNGAKLTNDYVTLDHGQTVNPDVNGTVELPVYATSPMEVGAVSLILNFPSDKLEIEGITMNNNTDTPLKFNVIGDELRIGWNSMNTLDLKAGDKLLTLTVKLISTLSKDETLRFDLAANPLNELDDVTAKPIDNTVLSMNVIGSTLGISSPGEGNLLLANYPNPFDESTTIAYTLPKAGEVTLEIRNLLGTVIQTLVTNKLQAAGDYKLKLDNNLLESGMYMATLKLNSDGKVMSHIIKIVCAR
jgi:hypothetical protein